MMGHQSCVFEVGQRSIEVTRGQILTFGENRINSKSEQWVILKPTIKVVLIEFSLAL